MNVMTVAREELANVEVTQILNNLKKQTVPVAATDTPVKKSLVVRE